MGSKVDSTLIAEEDVFTPVEYREKKKSGMLTDGLFVLAGDEKSGKTSFMASFPDSYNLIIDKGGADRLNGRFHEINDLSTFRKAFKWAMQEPSIKTVGIDTLTGLCDFFEDEVANNHGLSSITERKPGIDGFELWGEYNDKIDALISYIKESSKLVIASAHLKPAALDNNGNITAPAGLDLYPKASRIVGTKADVIGQCYKKQLASGAEYYLTFKGSLAGKLGSRVDELNDREIKLPKNNPYSAFEALFKSGSSK